MKKYLGTLVVSTSILASPLALAPSALAVSASPACTSTSSTPITGDSHTFTPASSCTFVEWVASTVAASDVLVTVNGTSVPQGATTAVPSGATVVFTYSGSAVGGVSLAFGDGNPPTFEAGYTITTSGTSGGGGGSSSGSSSSSAPSPVVQSFGKPAAGTCDEAASEDLNWSGVASGGTIALTV